VKKVGAFCWLSLAICIVELLICIKFGHGMFSIYILLSLCFHLAKLCSIGETSKMIFF
jgi:hypothetical protein